MAYFLENISTTYSILYVFVLLSATARWNWRGALWTTGLLLLLQVILFVLTGTVIQFLIQYTFLIVVGGVFAFFGASRERSGQKLMELAAWPSARPDMLSDIGQHWLDASLIHIATVLRAPRVLVFWEIAQEPYTFMAIIADGKCRQDRNLSSGFGNLVAAGLATATFASEAIKSRECLTSEGTKHLIEPILNDSFQTRFEISSVCSAPFSGEICNGRVFILDRSDWTEDDLILADVVASRLRIELEHYALGVRLEESAVSRERMRLARDLHDGILQCLTAAGLQLKTISARSDQNIQPEIENIRKLLLGEQKQIRAFVDGSEALTSHQPSTLLMEVQTEIKNIECQWHCAVSLSVTPENIAVSPELNRQIQFILAEAVANAVKHGNASHIDVGAKRIPDGIELRIADNGRGLTSGPGLYDQIELAALGIGPKSIRNRIAELRGTLALSTSSKGVELCITLPGGNQRADESNDKANAYC